MAEATRRSEQYQWLVAADLYRRAFETLGPSVNISETTGLLELLAHSYFNGAFQSENREDFCRWMELAKATYSETVALHMRAGSEAQSKRAEARLLFASFWLKEDPDEKHGIIERCIELAEQARQTLKDDQEARLLAEVQKELLTYHLEACQFAPDWNHLKELFKNAMGISDNAIKAFELLGKDEGLLESLSLTLGLLLGVAGNVVEPTDFQELEKKIEKLGTRLAGVSSKVGTPYALCVQKEAEGWIAQDVSGDPEAALKLFEEGASASKATRNSLLIGRLYTGALRAAVWAELNKEEVEERILLLEKGLEFAPAAIKNLEVSLHGAWLDWAYSFCAECYSRLAISAETETEKKKAHLRKTVEIARKGIFYKKHTTTSYVGHALTKAMYFLATMGVSNDEKLQLLREALPIREEMVRNMDRVAPYSWDRGVTRNYLALIKAELSDMERNPQVKRELLQGAVSDMKQCVGLCEKWATSQGLIRALARYYEWYGDILQRLHGLAGDTSTAQQAINTYHEAIEYLNKSLHVGPIGGVRWKIAKLEDSMGNYGESSRLFKKSAEDYRLAVQKLPRLSSTFQELASYMDAWSLIEEARVHHEDEQFLLARETYTRVAGLLQTTRDWRHLSNHYEACSFLEAGEDLSRQEQQEASIESFNAAVKAFKESESDLEKRLRENLRSPEGEDLKEWLAITHGRKKYCLGRRELEEAKVLDRKGEEEASSRKYSSASQLFKELLAGATVEQSRRELETLALSGDAWATMEEAEIKGSPELYAEAADIFIEIGDIATKKKPRIQAQANSSICKALESGTLFRRTRNTQLYSEVKKHLEAATDYYQEAGLQNAANWTRGTANLFDALVYMANAATEIDSNKKSELYRIAEGHLQLAAKRYGVAGFPTKRDEALKHLERAREEKELLLTPSDALSENPAITGITVTPVSLIRDQAVGLEKFEEAHVVGNITLPQYELNAGSDLTIELELANVGKTPATLVRVDNIAPQGFELDAGRMPYHFERNFIDMKGKRLEYLKTHEIKIQLRAKRKGKYELRPRVLYVNEKGNPSSYEFESVALTVRELGISGWLKGPK